MKREVKPARSVWHKPALLLPCPVVTGPLSLPAPYPSLTPDLHDRQCGLLVPRSGAYE